MKSLLSVFILFCSLCLKCQEIDSLKLREIYDFNLQQSNCYENLRSLCKDVGHRLSGSKSAQKAVEWAELLMKNSNLDTVYLQQIIVPHWERGDIEKVYWKNINGETVDVNCTALGGSVSTNGIVNGEVVEIKNWGQLEEFGKNKIKGKIIFFNRVMNPTFINTGMAYGSCVDQRHSGASRAVEYGAIGVLVRSMTLKFDNIPHTGSMSYADSTKKIPAVAISTVDAHNLSEALKNNELKHLSMELSCKQLDDTSSYNVIGEIKGQEFPDEIILVGGHLDSWDIGEGAHDDGAGVVQSLQVLETFKKLKLKSKRTLRCVMYMNEENGNRGGKHYASMVRKTGEKHLFALESDRGGFSPRGFSIDGTKIQLEYLQSFEKLFKPYQLHVFSEGYSGVDIGPLKDGKLCLVGLIPDSQRYFDFHHSKADVFENVHKRELELGASAISSIVYLVDKYGLPENKSLKK
ncbi:MAG: M20/M25/M40 family metallo-hydrolase [Flavobacteriales bacterium]|nr:M20/M25/M40 family metallo-hydrolase [Flavobacteriales bacterium]